MPSHQDRRQPLPADYQFPTNCACPSCAGRLTPEAGPHCCPKCQGPSYRGGLCINCTSVAEPTHDTPWGV